MGEQGDLDAIQMLTSIHYRQGDYQRAAYWGRKSAAFDDATCLYLMGDSTRNAAQQILQQIRDEKTKRANQNNCFITTAVCGSFGKADDCFELTTFKKFRDEWLTAQPEGKSLIVEYYAVAPQIVANINQLPNPSQVYKTIWQKYLEPCINFLRNDDNLSCKNKYSEMMRELKKQFLQTFEKSNK